MTGGLIPRARSSGVFQSLSPRTRGVKQGLFIFLLTFLVVPITAIISVAIHAPLWGVPIAAIVLFVGGLLRMAYAAMFESATPDESSAEAFAVTDGRALVNRNPMATLPPHPTSIPANKYVSPPAGQWRGANDPDLRSVTEGTTKLLENEETPQ